MKKIHTVAVYLGSADIADPVFRRAVIDLANFLADHDMTLVFGGSSCGMMKLLADTMLARNGKVIGVFTKSLPEKLIRHDLTESIITENLAERKSEMLKHADAIVALPGSIGTFDELFDALAQKKLGAINCPIGVLNVDGFFDPLFELLKKSKEAGFTSQKAFVMLKSGRTPGELLENMNKTVNGKGE
jgi:uncharacterized protein (TIGR00730 family)